MSASSPLHGGPGPQSERSLPRGRKRTPVFTAQYARLFEAAGCRTQVELAGVLGIRQSSVSDAKRRNTLPAEWLLRLLQRKGINPEWILSGQGARFLLPCEGNASARCSAQAVQPVPAEGAARTSPSVCIYPSGQCPVQSLVTDLLRRALAALQHGD